MPRSLARGHRGRSGRRLKRNYLETRLFGRTLAESTSTLSDGTGCSSAGTRSATRTSSALRDDPAVDPRSGALAAHVPGRARRVPQVLRPLAGDRQDDRARRSGRRDRRPVDRRARHAADDADVPHRWHRRQRHRRRSAPRRRAVRGSFAEGQGHARPHVGCRAHRRGRGQGPRHHDRRRRRHRGGPHRPDHPAPRGGRRPGDPAGDPIVGDDKTPRDPKELLEIKGVRETQQYLVQRGAEGVPRPGRVDPRQAHRADRPADDAPGRRAGAGRQRLPARRAGRRARCTPTSTASSCRRARRRPRAVPS